MALESRLWHQRWTLVYPGIPVYLSVLRYTQVYPIVTKVYLGKNLGITSMIFRFYLGIPSSTWVYLGIIRYTLGILGIIRYTWVYLGILFVLYCWWMFCKAPINFVIIWNNLCLVSLNRIFNSRKKFPAE